MHHEPARRNTLIYCAAAAAVMLLLSSCTGGGSKSASTNGGVAAASAGMSINQKGALAPVNSGAQGAGSRSAASSEPYTVTSTPLQQRDIVRTAVVAIRTAQVDATADAVVALAKAAGGRIDGDDRQSSTDKTGKTTRSATLVLRLPPAQLDDVLTKSVRLGTELSRSVHGEDVTASHADINARVAALTTSVGRLTDFLKHSGSIQDLVALESDLSQRQAELDSTVGQQQALADEIALSSLTVQLSEPPAVVPPPVKAAHGPSGFGTAVARGWHALAVSFRWLAAVVGYALPFLVILTVIAAGAGYARRRRAVTPGSPEAVAPSGAATP